MNRIERFYKLDKLLKEGPRNSRALRDAIEVSPATLKRDIEYMRERLYAPIIYDRSIGAYRFDQSSADHKRYALPGLWFSANEIHALLAAAHLLEQIEPGGILERQISPQRLVHYRENWYLDAWCHLRNDLRNFAVDAITHIDILDRPTKEISAQTLDDIFGPGYGIFSGSKVDWAVLKFSPTRARWVAHEQWHPQQKNRVDDNGYYLLEIPYSDHRELTMDVLKYGDECEVLAPETLRLHIAQTVEKMRKKYFS